ncbi:hypothetical protein J3Q64DRAFT_1823795 [Phycomyces blakesleeanus]|uniref:C2H2-type domain-containing protein n=1 Tax=Phycomyces blakesleeanus TaxID=4837 RepID=A0ABR3AT78_PHYBL
MTNRIMKTYFWFHWTYETRASHGIYTNTVGRNMQNSTDLNTRTIFCNFCDYQSNLQSNLRRHMSSHRESYRQPKCFFCERRFRNRFNVARHKKICNMAPTNTDVSNI